MTGIDPTSLPESDPRRHTIQVRERLDDLVDHLRSDVTKVRDPRAEALFETTAEVLAGLSKAFSDFEEARRARVATGAMKRRREPPASERPDAAGVTADGVSLGHRGPGVEPNRRCAPRPTRSVRAVAAAIIVFAVGACSSTRTTTTAPSTIGPGAARSTLVGAGSTFDVPFFAAAFAKYQQQHPGVTISYSGVGSTAGIAAISAQQVDFGASDSPMTAHQEAAAKGGSVTQVPVDLGGEGVAYNLPIPAGAKLHLSGPVLAGVFLGQITRWNDPAIAALNPGVSLPDASITVVHRSDGSGTTYIFSDYLSSVDPAWASEVGTAQTLKWPAGQGAEGNAGVATTVFRTPFAIGYVEQAYAVGLKLPFAAIRNQAGNYVIPSVQTVDAAAAQKPAISPTDFSIVNQPGATSYPISGYSWALIYTQQSHQARGQALVAMLDWLTHDGQTYAAENGYAPLPTQIQQLAHTTLQQVTGPNGTHLLG